ncbi:MAG: DUF4129 domain-containing protein [Actinomycetota bacterium]|nr:DUF4129 domain-containing protein [Actinomycetota bacterium]
MQQRRREPELEDSRLGVAHERAWAPVAGPPDAGMKNQRILLLAGVAVGLLLIAAALAPETGALFRRGSQDQVVVADTPVLFDYLMLLVVAIAFSGVLFLRASARRRIAIGRPVSPWRRVVAPLILVALWVTFPGVRTLVTNVLGELGVSGQAFDRPAEGLSDGLPEAISSRLAGYVLTVAFAVLIVGLAALVLILWHKRPQPDDDRAADEGLLSDIDGGLEDLSTITDPRAAVIACYGRMMRAAAAAGVERRASDTPLEALHRLLENHGVTEPSARRLTLLFERAKFSNHPIDETMGTDALDALLEVRSELGVSV